MAALVGTAIVAVLPELVKTQEYIAKELDRLGISYKKNKNDSGIIGEIKGGHSRKINRHSPYLSITLHKRYPYYLFGISTFPNSAYHSIALRKFSITIV